MIDWIRIDELRDEVGQDDFGDIVGVFFEEVQEALENLRRADTVVTLLGQLHFLQGSALNLGFSNFAAICRNEENSLQKDPSYKVELIRFTGNLALQNNNFMRAI
jgi:HPt (histidine-containing phosphotransfer) domain-containing protein